MSRYASCQGFCDIMCFSCGKKPDGLWAGEQTIEVRRSCAVDVLARQELTKGRVAFWEAVFTVAAADLRARGRNAGVRDERRV